MSEYKNQRQRILDLLLAAGGSEVPSVALSRISLQYGARVKELRSAGHNIENRTERARGKVCGFFCLKKELPVRGPASLPKDTLSGRSLFGEECRESEYPD